MFDFFFLFATHLTKKAKNNKQQPLIKKKKTSKPFGSLEESSPFYSKINRGFFFSTPIYYHGVKNKILKHGSYINMDF